METDIKTKYISIWDKGNEILYQLCKDYPEHTDFQITVAKSWLIGRSYSVSLERRYKKVSGDQDRKIRQVYEDFHKRWNDLSLQSSLRHEMMKKGMLNSINEVEFLETLRLHKKLTESLKGISGQGISFASKYLHFHAPLRYPIYDQISKLTLKSKLGNLYQTRTDIDLTSEFCDDEYLVFCWNLLKFKNMLEREENDLRILSFREVDSFLQGQ